MIVRKIQYLIALAQEGHFARAAAACNVSQPTLSAGIQQLELELGVQIVKRGQRFHGFTEQGEAVLAWAHRSAHECQQLRELLRERVSDASGHLEIGVLTSASPILRFFTTRFRRQYPNVSLRIVEQSALAIQHAVESSKLDIAITNMDANSIGYRRSSLLYAEAYQLIVRRGSLLSGRGFATWDEARHLPLCLPTPETGWIGSCELEVLWPTAEDLPFLVTNAVWTLLDHARTGTWATILPRSGLALIENDRELEAISLPALGECHIGVAAPYRKDISPFADIFFEVTTDRGNLDLLDAALHTAPTPSDHRFSRSINRNLLFDPVSK